jgi:hypothetical protein
MSALRAVGGEADEFLVRDRPGYWLAILGMAQERGDFERAAEARRELSRLGVRVMYGRRPGNVGLRK